MTTTVLHIRGEADEEVPGTLVYSDSEHSFRFEPGAPAVLNERAGNAGLTSLALGTLQLEVGVATGLVLFVWGFHAKALWRLERLVLPRARPALVEVVSPQPLKTGVSHQLASVAELSTSYDDESGWIRVGLQSAEPDEQLIIVATGTCLGLQGERLSSIWLRPVWEP